MAFGSVLAVLAAVLLGAVVLVPASATPTGPVVETLGFGVTGAAQQFVVPDGVRSLEVTLAGGAGGDGSSARGSQSEVTPGGKGAVVRATLPVTPGQVLYLYTGDRGTPTDFSLPAGTTECVAAFGGGGRPGYQPGGYDQLPMCGPGGGGASDIRTSEDLSSRLVVAGGGGGSAQSYALWSLAPCLSWSGGDSGAQGEPIVACEPTVVGGMPGTLTSGGDGTDTYYTDEPYAPYRPGEVTCQGSSILGDVYPGGDGTLGQGGHAGWGPLREGENPSNYVPVGGAGGGGYYGGGGGAPAWYNGGFCRGISGGGGGSSYAAPAVRNAQISEGANSGTGWITISWVTLNRER